MGCFWQGLPHKGASRSASASDIRKWLSGEIPQKIKAMEGLSKDEKKKLRNQIEFWICLLTSIGLLIGGFFTPPMAVIDGSVLQAVGLLLGFATLAQLPVVLSSAKSAKITHGDTSIEVTNKKKEEENK